MNKNLAINSGDLRLWKSTSGKQFPVVVLFAEMSEINFIFTGWWWVIGGEGCKRYLVPSHSLFNLIQGK